VQTFEIKLFLTMPGRRILGAEVQLHSFLTSALDGAECSVLCLDRFTSRKNPGILLIGEPQRRYGCSEENKIFSPCQELFALY
jgi:hypothetical protein